MTLRMLLRRLPEASFTVVDRSEASLERARALGPHRLAAERRDVAADGPPNLAGCDAVINLAGPFYRGSDTVARAAMEAGVAYIDICDDAEGAQAILDLDEEAAAARVPLITGAGNSPGMSNVMGKKLLADFPNCDGVRVVWVVRDANPGGLAPLRHMLHMAVSPCPIWRDGKLDDTPGFVPSTRRDYVLPEPVGATAAFDTAHPEPLTMGRAYPELRHVSVQGALLPNWANEAFSMLGRLGFGYHDLTVEVDGATVHPDEVLWKLLWARHKRRSGAGAMRGLTCVQTQVLRGDEVCATMTILDDHSMVRTTGLGAATAVLCVLERRPSPGAWGTEVLDADRALEILSELAEAEGALPQGIIRERATEPVAR